MTRAALDTAALSLLQSLARAEASPNARARHNVDDALDSLYALLAKRIRMLVVRHGLADMGEDAE